MAALSASLPTNAQLITYVKRSEREKLKEVASEHLEKLVGFIAQVKSMIVEGCTTDMEAIALSGGFGRTEDLEHVISESVQRIVEIEVYVPLRSLLSRVIVNAYRKDDVLIQQRIQVSHSPLFGERSRTVLTHSRSNCSTRTRRGLTSPLNCRAPACGRPLARF